MKTIAVTDDYRIAIDDGNYIVQSRKISKSGVERWSSESFFPSLEYACVELLDLIPQDSTESDDIEGLLNAVREAERNILDAIQYEQE